MWTSATRQAVSSSERDSKKSVADENSSTAYPSSITSLRIDSRKSWSSSTIDISVRYDIVASGPLLALNLSTPDFGIRVHWDLSTVSHKAMPLPLRRWLRRVAFLPG